MKFRNVALIVSLTTYGFSLYLPALHGEKGKFVDGTTLLFFGWVQAIAGQCFAWFANPLYVSAVFMFMFRVYRIAATYLFAAALVGLDTFRAKTFPTHSYDVPIDSVGPAFYVWELSVLIMAVSAVYLEIAQSKRVRGLD